MDYPLFDDKITLSHVMDHPHGRRMICAIVSLVPPNKLEFSKAFFSFLSSPENRRSVLPLVSDSFSPMMRFRMTLQSDGSFCEACDDLSSADAYAMRQNAEDPGDDFASGHLDMLDLASPLLTKKAVVGLFTASGTSANSKTVLRANPNCPDDLKGSFTDEDLPLLARVSARYGDLDDPAVVDTIERGLLIRDGGKPTRILCVTTRTDVMSLLLLRPKLNSLVVPVMDRYATSKEHALLETVPEYQAYVQDRFRGNEVSLAEILSSQYETKIPRFVTSENLAKLYEAAGKKTKPARPLSVTARLRVSIALHPNADRKLLEKVLTSSEERSCLATQIDGTKSPHADWLIRAGGSTGAPFLKPYVCGTIKSIEPSTLLWAASLPDGSPNSVTRKLCHPNFPWREANVDAILAKNNVSRKDVVLAAVCLSHASGPAFERTLETESYAMLFSPSLSGVRLAKIASKFPELAPLAACHPNGGDIVIRDAATRSVIERFRTKFNEPMLRGRAGIDSSDKTTTKLEL